MATTLVHRAGPVGRRALSSISTPLVHRAGPEGARATAVLFGWTAGKLSAVRKHEAIWHELGFATLTATTSIDDTFLPPHRSALVETATRLAAAAGEARTPLVPHVFSNGGAILYVETGRQAAKRGTPLAVAGAVFDSVPSPVSDIRPIAAPIVIASAGLPLLETVGAMARHLPYAHAAEASRLFRGVAGQGWAMPEPLDRRVALTHLDPVDELYLFSDGDNLIRPASVLDHAREREANGATVTSVAFDNSPHCAHLRTHPEAYRAAVAAFVETLDLDEKGGRP